jgi:hypothetical protein
LLAATAAALLSALVLAPSALAVPANDDQALAFPVDLTTGDPVTVNTVGATVELGEPLTASGTGVCNPGARQMTATTWYRIVGNGGVVSIDTAGSDFDTVISVYFAPTPSLDDGLPCNDDAAAGVVTSAVSFQSVAGRAYLVQVGGCDCGAAVVKEGNLTMHATAAAPPPPPTPPAPPAPPAPPPIVIVPPDTDGDGIPDARDPCPTVKPTRDANNDGCQDKPIRILSDLKYDGSFIKRGGAIGGITLSRVRLTRVPAGARVSVSCAGCRRAVGGGGTRRFTSFTLTAKNTGTQTMGRLNRLQLLRGRRIVVVVTQPEHLGRLVVVRMGARRDAVTLKCLAVGSSTKRVACSTGG